LEFFLRRL